MNKHYFEKIFSNERMQKYFDHYPNDEAKSILLYEINIKLSEALYPILCVFEIALRNSLNRELNTHFGTEDWYLNISNSPGLKELNFDISNAKRLIVKRGEMISSSKVIAELTLGFWVKLLNAEYELILWKSLRRGFPYMPKNLRIRHNISAPLNKIRNLRNRVFHHEPIVWNLNQLEFIHADIVKVNGWINSDLPNFILKIDFFTTVLAEAKEKLSV